MKRGWVESEMCKCTKETKVLYPKESVDIMRVQNMCKCGKRTTLRGQKPHLHKPKMHAWENPSGAKVNPTCKRAHVRPPGPSTQAGRTPGVYNAEEKQLKTSTRKLDRSMRTAQQNACALQAPTTTPTTLARTPDACNNNDRNVH